jgi:hypothetical protein
MVGLGVAEPAHESARPQTLTGAAASLTVIDL